MKKSFLWPRLSVIQLLMFWQGGFLFYALVVVPVGGEVLGSVLQQGLITRNVTWWLNGIGLAALTAAAVEIQFIVDPWRQRKFLRFMMIAFAYLIQLILIVIHDTLDHMIDAEGSIPERKRFYEIHRIYLLSSGFLWLHMIAFLGVSLSKWRDDDRRISTLP